MTEFIVDALKTGVVQQRGLTTRITKEAVQSMARPLDGQAIPILVDHDPSGMPIGKVRELWTEQSGQDYVARARLHVEDRERRDLHLRTGTELVYFDFEDAPEPFRRREVRSEEDGVRVHVDLANFDSYGDYEAFLDAVGDLEGLTQEHIGRHSSIPEPLIQFIVSNVDIATVLAVGLWVIRRVEKFVRYTVDESLRKIADQASDLLSAKIRRVVKEYQQRHADQDAEILSEILVPGNLDLVLLIRVSPGEEFPGVALAELVATMESYGDLLQDAQEATFALAAGEWELLHIKTRTGKVLGTSTCYERTVSRLERIRKSREKANRLSSVPGGFSVGGVTSEDDDAGRRTKPTSPESDPASSSAAE